MTVGGRSRPDRAPSERARAQTQQDFALGVSVFLIAVVSTFAILPTTLTAGGQGDERASYAAERTASAVIDRTSDGLAANTLNASALATFFRNHPGEGDVVANYSLREPSGESRHANVTLEPLDGGPPVSVPGTAVTGAAGGTYPGVQTAGTAARVVRIDGARYRLVVTVW